MPRWKRRDLGLRNQPDSQSEPPVRRSVQAAKRTKHHRWPRSRREIGNERRSKRPRARKHVRAQGNRIAFRMSLAQCPSRNSSRSPLGASAPESGGASRTVAPRPRRPHSSANRRGVLFPLATTHRRGRTLAGRARRRWSQPNLAAHLPPFPPVIRRWQRQAGQSVAARVQITRSLPELVRAQSRGRQTGRGEQQSKPRPSRPARIRSFSFEPRSWERAGSVGRRWSGLNPEVLRVAGGG